MDYLSYFSSVCVFFGLIQLLSGAAVDEKYEPMVAFICDRPTMYRGVNGWIADKSQDCPDTLQDVLNYCKKVYPNHTITNVVESSRFYDIPNWPMGNTGRKHTHHVRPYRCLVGGFQSDALLVPPHCEFDHRHDISQCKEFSHWNTVAEEACNAKGMHLESFGMLLYCKPLGHFNGVEYVCCPYESKARVLPEPEDDDDNPDKWSEESQEEDSDSSEEESVSSSSSDSTSTSMSDSSPNENVVDLYEAYLRGLPFPDEYDNEHKKFLAAKKRMKLNQKRKIDKLLQEWQKAREHVSVTRKTDPKRADQINEEIATKFKEMYEMFQQEHEAELIQLTALHHQHVQALLNERKREAMDKYMRALETGEVTKVAKYLHNYINAEEKDRMHTVKHFEHVRYSTPKEALRIHPHIINHLQLSEKRIDQALDMLTRYPDIEAKIRPEVEEYLKRFNDIATSIKNVVLPVPVVEEEEDSMEEASDSSDTTSEESINDSESRYDSSSEEIVSTSQGRNEDNLFNNNVVIDDEVQEDEHSYERQHFAANAQADTHSVNRGLRSNTASGSQLGSTLGIALGSVSVFVIVVVAIIMVRRNQSRQSVSHGYVEVDPSASPEERHLANMQMNGYENPTYKYFEVQNNPKA